MSQKVDIFDTDNIYEILYIDPPWKQSKGGKKSARPKSSGTGLDYPVLSLENIEALMKQAVSHTPVDSLWTIDKYLFDAQTIAEKLGYKLHARMIWNWAFLGIHSDLGTNICYICIKESLFQWRKKPHGIYSSQKPVEIIEELYPTQKKQNICRNYREGWEMRCK